MAAHYLNVLRQIQNLHPPRRRRPKRELRGVRLFRDPMEYYTDGEFLRRYRFRKSAVREVLLPLLRQELEFTTNRNDGASALEQILIFLRFLATGTFHLVGGDLAVVTDRSEASVCRYVHKVAEAIAARAGRYIRMPAPAEIRDVQDKFHQMHAFPSVVGAIDCVHVPIAKPATANAEEFRCRKGFFSLNVQGVCDTDLVFLDLVSRWPGSFHDSRIFDLSSLKARFERGEFRNCLLIGDAGYALHTYLMTPLRNPVTPSDHRYQFAHIHTRNVIERAFGVLKRRFPALHQGLRFSPARSAIIIVAAVVLHNIARRRGEFDFDDDDFVVDDHDFNPPFGGTLARGRESALARRARERLIQVHFS